MVDVQYKVVWTQRSQNQLKRLFEFISKDSEQNALVILEEIVLSINKAQPNPEFYRPDKYKAHNDGTYRAYEKHHYRISYRFDNCVIRVLRVRHTSRKPVKY